jgi:hypothetical protein
MVLTVYSPAINIPAWQPPGCNLKELTGTDVVAVCELAQDILYAL